MKKIILAIIAGVLLISCGGITTPDTGISTKEDLSKIKGILEEKIGGDKEIVSLFLMTNSPKVCKFEVGTVVTKDKNYGYLVQTDQVIENDPNLRDDQKKAKPIKLSSWNVDEFIPIKDKAIALIESKSKNFSDFKVESLSVYATEKGTLEYSFDLVGNKTNEGVSYIGDRIRQGESLFEFEFHYDVAEKRLLTNTKGLKE